MRVVLAGMTVAVTMAAAVIRLPAQDARLVDIPIGLDLYVPAPEDNAITPEKIALGRRLFFDRRLSGDSKTACVTCHQPARAFTDGRRLPRGAFGRPGRRNAPSLFNRAYGETFFWDGRAATLEDQALAALAGDTDLALSGDKASTRLATDATYVAEFQAAFGGGPSADRMAQALATFVRAQLAGSSAVDRFVEGDLQALSLAARRGRDLNAAEEQEEGDRPADETNHRQADPVAPGELGSRGRCEDDRQGQEHRRHEDVSGGDEGVRVRPLDRVRVHERRDAADRGGEEDKEQARGRVPALTVPHHDLTREAYGLRGYGIDNTDMVRAYITRVYPSGGPAVEKAESSTGDSRPTLCPRSQHEVRECASGAGFDARPIRRARLLELTSSRLRP